MLEKRYQEQMHRIQSEFQSERENLSQQNMNLRKERASAQSMAVENQMKLENIISSLKVVSNSYYTHLIIASRF